MGLGERQQLRVYLLTASRDVQDAGEGPECLVRILHDFCTSPPPPDNPATFPPGSHPPKPQPTLLPKSYDKHAAYRFSLAFQCIVNIGVRGSEPIRSRVVQAGTLEVVGCILEAWLASKGFPVGPSVTANGMPRETRERAFSCRVEQAFALQFAFELFERLLQSSCANRLHDLAEQLVEPHAPSSGFAVHPGGSCLATVSTTYKQQTCLATESRLCVHRHCFCLRYTIRDANAVP